MEKKTNIHSVDLIRRIRDRQADLLKGKSNEEIIEFFRKAGEATRRRGRTKGLVTGNKRTQPPARKASCG